MTPSTPQAHDRRQPCNGCGGSGQISFFRGVSRFVMDWDDCPDCLGTGYIEKAPDTPPRQNESAREQQEDRAAAGDSSANRNPQAES